MNEDSIYFDGIAWLRAQETILGCKRGDKQCTSFRNAAHGDGWIEDDLWKWLVEFRSYIVRRWTRRFYEIDRAVLSFKPNTSISIEM
jgi:hypothetical protein